MRMQKLNIELEREVDGLGKLLESLPNGFDFNTRREILEDGAKVVVKAARELAPKSKKTHYMYYQGNKLQRGLRAPKGSGQISAVFHPGNLSRSIQILKHGPFRRSPNVFVGPRYPTRRTSRNRAPYAHMVEFGTAKQSRQPYMRPAYEMTKSAVLQRVTFQFRRALDRIVTNAKRKAA